MVRIRNAATPADIALWRRQCGLPPDPSLPEQVKPKPQPRGMNKTEQAYAAHLDTLKRNGDVVAYAFEVIRIRLAEGATYKPDFVVVWRDGRTEFHEVKGYMHDAAAIRLKVAREVCPIPFVLVRRRRGGGWTLSAVAARMARR